MNRYRMNHAINCRCLSRLIVIMTLCLSVSATVSTQARAAGEPRIAIKTQMPPPGWALLERALLRANTAACREFFARYFDERGYL